MRSFQYTITDEVGIHARPAGLLAKTAKEFESEITVKSEGKSAGAKKLMALMAMGIRCGQTVTVTCEGSDEDGAAKALEIFFKENL